MTDAPKKEWSPPTITFIAKAKESSNHDFCPPGHQGGHSGGDGHGHTKFDCSIDS
jgi:hypothetical protein